MLRIIIFCVLVFNALGEDYRTVVLKQGSVAGEKYWNGDFYIFHGIPYATAPKGRDRYKGPLPVEKWTGVFEANADRIVCHQTFYTGEESEKIYLAGQEDCLVMNIFVPEVAAENNLVPVIVYIHSGAFAAGNGNMAKYHYLARHDIIVISFNFRLGALGFACLGTEEIPGNAGIKDIVAAIKWINKNIRKFGGDPKKVTLAGFSVGATLAELVALSKPVQGMIDKLVLDSGSALSPYAINRDPISTAKNIAISMGYNGTDDVQELTEFYLNASSDLLAAKSLNFFLPNSTFGFAPCIEDANQEGTVLTESPLDILKRGDYQKMAVLSGIASMEGLSRTIKFDTWSEMMNTNFGDFLPADLIFDSEKSKDEIIRMNKEYYFKGEKVSDKTLQSYIDYFSDSMFRYPIMKSVKFHVANSNRPLYFYEFDYFGEFSMQHNYMGRIKGASHRDQSSYVLDFFTIGGSYNDLDMRDKMTSMWADFVKYENPTVYESPVVDFKWLKYTEKEQNYLVINLKSEMKKDLFVNGYYFWSMIYDKYYWNPTAPKVKKSSDK